MYSLIRTAWNARNAASRVSKKERRAVPSRRAAPGSALAAVPCTELCPTLSRQALLIDAARASMQGGSAGAYAGTTKFTVEIEPGLDTLKSRWQAYAAEATNQKLCPT